LDHSHDFSAVNDLPIGTVTFVFTDVEGSTRLLQKDAAALSAALKVHHEQLSRAAEAHGGVVFERAGDGAFVAFRKASGALAAVLEVQRLTHEPAAAGLPRLRVRAAVHSGEVEMRGDGYFGPPLFRCARLMAIAHGGQTLVSRAARDLVLDSLPAGVQLRSLGTHGLRDFPTPEEVFQLVHPEIEADFAPLRSLDTLPNNLPQQLTSFVGRQEELALVDRLLRSSRLVTLTGAGGSGKTRLALQVSAGIAGRYPDGVWLVDLSTLSDEAQMVQQLASVLGVREEPVRPLLATLADAVRDQALLLVLDNCEHIIHDAAPIVSRLLQASPDLRVLATSREALGIAGETAWRVPSLASPEPADVATKADGPAGYPAVQLFVDRAKAAMPGFELTAANEQLVARITRRLDGIPLAIELAAARVAAIPLEVIAERLEDVFGLLTGGSRTAPERQQTLRAAIDWSYDQLGPAERALFARLSVFAGGWTLEAAEAIGEGLHATPLDLLASLVAKSLVVLDADDGGGRYRYLEPIRAYARLRLGELGNEQQQAQNAHLDYFVRLAEEAEPHLLGREQARWFGKMEREHDNLRTAVAYAGESGRAEDGLRIVGALWMSWWVNGRFSEGRQVLEKLLPRVPTSSKRLRARSLTGAGFLAAVRTDFDLAEQALKQGLDLARSAGDPRSTAWALHGLGVLAAYRADYEEQAERESEAVELFRQLDDRSGMVPALGVLALAALTTGRPEEAIALLDEGLAIGRDVGNAFGVNFLLLYLGIARGALARQRGDGELIAVSRVNLREGLELSRRVGDRFHVALGLDVLAEHIAADGDPERAVRLLGAAHALREAIGAPVLPPVRDYQRQVAERIRGALSEAVFRERWEEGLAIPMDEAIGYAGDG
jgi:predicted ATPase/class 3 adenylate cyclase